NELAVGLQLVAWGGRRVRPPQGPGVEGGGRLGDDEERHVGVLEAAVLGALTPAGAGPGRFEAPHVVLAGDGVELASELGHPEAAQHGVGLEAVLAGPTHGNVALVAGGDAVMRTAHRPP